MSRQATNKPDKLTPAQKRGLRDAAAAQAKLISKTSERDEAQRVRDDAVRYLAELNVGDTLTAATLGVSRQMIHKIVVGAKTQEIERRRAES